MVQARVLADPDELSRGGVSGAVLIAGPLRLLVRRRLRLRLGEVGVRSGRVLDLEGEDGDGSRDAIHGAHDELHLALRAARDGGVGLAHQALDVHDGLLGEVGDVLDHALAHADVVDEEDALDRRRLLAQDQERALALAADVVHAAAEGHRLVLLTRVHVPNVRPDLAGAGLGLDQGRVAVAIGEGIGTALLRELARGHLRGLRRLARLLLRRGGGLSRGEGVGGGGGGRDGEGGRGSGV